MQHIGKVKYNVNLVGVHAQNIDEFLDKGTEIYRKGYRGVIFWVNKNQSELPFMGDASRELTADEKQEFIAAKYLDEFRLKTWSKMCKSLSK
jgi:hypothetical protein